MLNQLYENVKLFNNLAGDNLTKQGFINQQKLVIEESNEIQEGIDNNNLVEILDGVIDTLYVTLGHLSRLEKLGVNVQGAIEQVCEDNTTKFPLNREVAQNSVVFYNAKNINVNWTFNEQYQRYVIKDENQKCRKPYNFIPTDLTQYVPENLQRKGLE